MASPRFDTADVLIAAPPEVERRARAGLLTRMVPVVMAAVVATMMVVLCYSRSGMTRNPMFVAFPLLMLVSSGVTAVAGRDRSTGDLNTGRADYLDHLSDLRRTVVKTAAAQRTSLFWCHPDPVSLWTLVGSSRMWERRSADTDFCQVRIGVGKQPLATRLVPPPMGPKHSDPVTTTALERFLQAYSTLTDVPVPLDLGGIAVTVAGQKAHARELLRAMICQLAVLHSPSRLLIVAVIGERSRSQWDWLKWLPHNQHPSAVDDVGSARMVYPTLAAAETALAAQLLRRAPHLVFVIDGDVVDGTEQIMAKHGLAGLTILQTGCDERALRAGVRLRVSAEQVVVDDEVVAQPDRMDSATALVCARRLAAFHAEESGGPEPHSGSPVWQELVGIADLATFTPTALWHNVIGRDVLRVPIGLTESGTPLELDIKEAAQHGMGPHGLCVGATGSGKSELLRSIALSMMVRHSPEVLNLALIDFKGGATFLGLEKVPHVAAVITNLSEEAPLVARMRDALTGEMNRRQQLLRAAGNLQSVAAYRQRRQAGARLAPLPALFIIVDEFSELLSQHPDFADVFMAIGRLGRSLGMHLLLASQRLDEGRLRGLESHLSYRICLKTLSAHESRIALGTSDAYELPNTPGTGYLRTATADPIRFQGAYVARRCPPIALATGVTGPDRVQPFTAEPVGPVRNPPEDDGASDSVVQTVVDRLSGHGPSAHEIWLPPLGPAPRLDSLLGAEAADLTVPIGIVDRPFEQRRTPLVVELSGSAGNVGVVGGPQSGKTTTLRTLITALALTHDPGRVQCYCLDFGGGALTSLRSLPHVGAVAGRAEPELVGRAIAELEALVASREALFRDRGIDSMAQYRRMMAQRDPVCDRYGDVFLVIDGWATLRNDFDGFEASITALAARGLSFGAHVVVSASRWAELRPALKDQLGTRIELRLGDPADSELDRRQAAQVPEGKPGRGLSRDGHHMLIALPGLNAVELAEMLRHRHGPTCAPGIPVLPTHVDHDTVVDSAGGELRNRVLLGVEERQLNPVAVDFDAHQHLLILGDSGCGKTGALRVLCREIVRTTTAAQAQLFIVDLRRALLGVVESEHLGGYAMSPATLGTVLPTLLDSLHRRMPPVQVTQTQLRARSWWSGPELYVVVDDYDLVTAAGGSPLSPMLEYVPHARDLGLHLVVARRASGAARAMYEPLLAELRDLGCMGLMMSASPDEGPLIGSVRPSPLPVGRGTLIARNDRQLVQVGWSPP
ncbi:secretion protein EccC [Mycobacterium shimoidei]|nr:type VII secretion protein EccC [Mycobacterium shimoidei]ORW76406.1 secretion protein EccC [Mycobacterium shimoidei]